jgi:DNA repair photolyase
MYPFVTHTWNPIRGKCVHACPYCYMQDIANEHKGGFWEPLKLVGKALADKHGKNKFIFVGSATDMFAENVPDDWITRVMVACYKNEDNAYLFQTKNPAKMLRLAMGTPAARTLLACTIESDEEGFRSWQVKSPKLIDRFVAFRDFDSPSKMVSIEPIMKFSPRFLSWLKELAPAKISIGADSKNHGLTEPTAQEVIDLITYLRTHVTTDIVLKKNLERLVGANVYNSLLG